MCTVYRGGLAGGVQRRGQRGPGDGVRSPITLEIAK
jgi:hypothetical protein